MSSHNTESSAGAFMPPDESSQETRVLLAGDARVEIAPGHGCLIQIMDPGTGNLLWRDGRPPQVLHGSNSTGDASASEFDDETLIGGWFPMFPTAGVATDHTQQHGWAPRVAWAVEDHTRSRIVCRAEGPFLDGGSASLTRTIELKERSLTVRSTVLNLERVPHTFTWGEHPCFSRERFAGGRVTFDGQLVQEVPTSVTADTGHLAREGHDVRTVVEGPGVSVALLDVGATLPHWLYWFSFAAPGLPRADTFAWEPSSAAGLGIADALTADGITRLDGGQSFTAHIRCEWTLLTTPTSSVR